MPGRRSPPRVFEVVWLPPIVRAPGNNALRGGLKVVAESGWFAVRPSGTEDVYKLYVARQRIRAEAQDLVEATFAPVEEKWTTSGTPPPGRFRASGVSLSYGSRSLRRHHEAPATAPAGRVPYCRRIRWRGSRTAPLTSSYTAQHNA